MTSSQPQGPGTLYVEQTERRGLPAVCMEPVGSTPQERSAQHEGCEVRQTARYKTSESFIDIWRCAALQSVASHQLQKHRRPRRGSGARTLAQQARCLLWAPTDRLGHTRDTARAHFEMVLKTTTDSFNPQSARSSGCGACGRPPRTARARGGCVQSGPSGGPTGVQQINSL